MNVCALVVFCGLSGYNAQSAEDLNKAELAKFQGTWQLVSALKDGTPIEDEIVGKIRVVIKEGKHSVYFDNTAISKDIPFVLDATKTPKTVEDKLPEGTTIKGIYRLENNTLTSCVADIGKARPTEFEAKAGSGRTLRVFKRVKD